MPRAVRWGKNQCNWWGLVAIAAEIAALFRPYASRSVTSDEVCVTREITFS